MRLCCLLLLFGTTGHGQTDHGISLETAYNRTGHQIDLSYHYRAYFYHLDVGARFMTMNRVFENRLPGIRIKNTIICRNYESEKIFALGLGLDNGLFFEGKSTSKLLLLNNIFGLRFDFRFQNNFNLNIRPGIGWVYNYTFVDESIPSNSFSFFNYELAIGLAYRFSFSD